MDDFVLRYFYIFFLSLISLLNVFVNFLLKLLSFYFSYPCICISCFFFVNIKIYQLVNEVEQEEGDGGIAGETFTDYVS